MTSGQKVAVSLLISVLLFAAFAVSAFAGLFSFVEARFYEPVVIRTIEQKLDDIEREQHSYSQILLQRFAAFTQEKSVQSFVQSRPSEKEVKERTELTGNLFVETSALKGIRLVDANGRNIHYSSFAYDRKKTTDKTISYSNYTDLGEVDISQIQASHSDKGPTATSSDSFIVCDSKNSRLIYSVPFYDSSSLFRGTMLFYCDPSDFNRFLVSRNIVPMSESLSLVSVPLSVTGSQVTQDNSLTAKKAGFGGYVFGLPVVGREILEEALLDRLSGSQEKVSAQALVSTEKGNWVLFSRRTFDGGFVAWLYTDDILVFSNEVKVLLLIVVFVTLFLGLFLIFNVKHDDMVVIRDQIRRFQLAFITEYVDARSSSDTSSLAGEITGRRQLLSKEIKKSLGRKAKRHEKEVDELLDKNWNEILGVLGVKKTAEIEGGAHPLSDRLDTAELKRLLEEVLENSRNQTRAVPVPAKPVPVKPAAEPIEDSEEVLEEAEPVEDAEEVLEEAEPVENAEEVLEEAEPVEDAEEVLEEAESVEDAEEVLEEAEPVEDAEEVLEEAESVEDAEEVLEEAEPLEDTEEVLEEAESVEDAEEVLEEAEPLEEAEEVLEEAEPVEDAEEVLEEAEPVEDAEEVLEEAEPLEEAEDIETVDPALFGVDEAAASETKEDDGPYSVDQINEFAEALEFSSPKPRKQLSESEEFEVGDFGAGGLDFSALDDQDASTRQHDTAFTTDDFTSDGTFPVTEPVTLDLTPEIEENPFIDQIADESALESEPASQAAPAEIVHEQISPVAEIAPETPAPVAEPERERATGESTHTETIEENEDTDMFMPLDDVEPLESLDEGLSSRAFSLTSFASKANGRVSYASSADESEKTDVIVEDADGTFHISEDTKNRRSPEPLNLDFKNLVDSVLG